MLEGALEVMLEGGLEAMLEGRLEAMLEGALDGLLEGALDGLLEGTLDGLGAVFEAGALEATAGAELPAAELAALWLVAEGVPAVVGSLPLQAPIGIVNPRTTIDANRMGQSLTHPRDLARSALAIKVERVQPVIVAR